MAQTQRKRNGRNSKNGCTTCKYVDGLAGRKQYGANTSRFRHVKCDEEKPACTQCIKTGRKCDGYENLSQGQLRQRVADSIVRPSPSTDTRLVLLPCTRKEREYVHLFCTETVRSLSGFFASDFWHYYLPQLSQSDVAVRHAITAIGAVHRRRLRSPDDAEPAQPFELQQYNQAINHLLNSPSPTLEHTLVVCSLFVCLELLKSNFSRAIEHIEAGLRILSEQQQGSPGFQHPVNVHREILSFFARMNLQLSFWAKPLIPFEEDGAREIPEETGFLDLADARRTLNQLMINTMMHVRFAFSGARDKDVRDDPNHQYIVQFQREMLATQYDSWWWAFEEMKRNLGRSRGKAPDPRAILVIQVHHHTLRVWGLNAGGPDEMMYDLFNDEFEQIVEWSEQISQLSTKDNRPFQLESDAVPALYVTARKCRHPLIRRRAIDLLGQRAAQEGMWTTRELSAIARYNMELEEAAVAHLPVEQRVPASDDRFFETNVLRLGNENPAEVVFLRQSQDTGELEHFTEFVSW